MHNLPRPLQLTLSVAMFGAIFVETFFKGVGTGTTLSACLAAGVAVAMADAAWRHRRKSK